MKKILLLMLIVLKSSAGFIDDLEKAITKSDLPTVEKLLAKNLSISIDEQVALITLATEIIRKCENKVLVNSVNPIDGFQTYHRKYLDKNQQLKAYDRNSIIYLFALLSIPIAPTIGLLVPRKLVEPVIATAFICSLVISTFGLVAAVYNARKYFNLREQLIIEHDAACKTRYDNAIKIRQLLFKIKPAASNK